MAPFKKKGEVQPPSAPAADDFAARRSSRVSRSCYAPDLDTWTEALAVCEVPAKSSQDDGATASSRRGGGGLLRRFKPSRNHDAHDDVDAAPLHGGWDVVAASQRLTLRPYFQSQNTGQRRWDEPPSGASNIVYATPELRRLAQAQLEEMKATYAEAAVRRRQEREERKAMEPPKPGRSLGSVSGNLIPKVFKRSSSASASATDASQSLLSNDGNAMPSRRRQSNGGIPSSILQESKELAGVDDGTSSYEQDLQKAMLMSIGVGGGSVMGVGNSTLRSRNTVQPGSAATNTGLTREEEDHLAMATALSLSEQESRQDNSERGSSNRRGDSKTSGNDGGGGKGSRKQRFRSHNGHLPLLSTSTDFYKSDDGGGELPGPACFEEHERGDFEDRGPSWELSWEEGEGSWTQSVLPAARVGSQGRPGR